ncbi:MAG: hypothetical protein ACREM1_07020 [Longimicrobiales bacterium]
MSEKKSCTLGWPGACRVALAAALADCASAPDWGDYSTNEPIMDGTANLVYMLSALYHLNAHDARPE